MRVITIKPFSKGTEPKHRPVIDPSANSPEIFFATENHLEFAIEALLFRALLAISIWPIVAAAGAITELLQSGAS
jgi:hypothetical protein